jgi:hypothetical protein
VGVALPDDAEDEFINTGEWNSTACPANPMHGHDILAVGYDANGFKIATWTGFVYATNSWITKYMDEGTMLLRRSWIQTSVGISPSGLTMEQLDAMITEAQGILGPSA